MKPVIFENSSYLLPGQILKYGLNDNGFIFALTREITDDQYDLKLVGVSLLEGLKWEYVVRQYDDCELRISDSGNAFLSIIDSILEITEEGEVVRESSFALDFDQRIGSFILLDRGKILCIEGKEKPNAAIVRIDENEKILWETQLIVPSIEYEGLVHAGVKTNWEVESMPPREAKSWRCSFRNEIIVTSDKALTSYFEYESGIGISYCMDIESGEVEWTTSPSPGGSKLYMGNNLFLIGCRGYGAYETNLWGQNGEIVDSWESVGYNIVSAKREILSIQWNRETNDHLSLVKLMGKGEITIGPKIEGNFPSYPAIDEYNNVVFFHKRSLSVIDSKFKKHTLHTLDHVGDRDYPSRIMIFGKGVIIFSLGKKLFVMKTNLGKLATSFCPCRYYNKERNPLIT